MRSKGLKGLIAGLLAACAAVMTLAACSTDPVATLQSNVVTINIYDFYYSPTGTSVRAGTAVQWINRGPSAHTATSDDGLWDSGSLSPPTSGGGGSTPPPTNPPPNPYAYSMNAAVNTFSFTPSTPGVYGFHCTLHPPATNPGFVGTLTVTE